MPQPLALVAQRLLAAGLEALGRLDERGQLAQARLLGGGAARQLVVALAGRAELAPREPSPRGGGRSCSSPTKASSTSSW